MASRRHQRPAHHPGDPLDRRAEANRISSPTTSPPTRHHCRKSSAGRLRTNSHPTTQRAGDPVRPVRFSIPIRLNRIHGGEEAIRPKRPNRSRNSLKGALGLHRAATGGTPLPLQIQPGAIGHDPDDVAPYSLTGRSSSPRAPDFGRQATRRNPDGDPAPKRA